MTLKNKTILVGVTGGIAAYKTCELVRLFVEEKAQVHVVMTEAATHFVTPLTFQALSMNPVKTEMMNLSAESQIGHIELADKMDACVVAPATADFIGQMASGLCGNLLATILCATKAPVVLAPSMNVNMYQNSIVQDNIRKLTKHGYHMVGPAKGKLACGWEGLGRLEEPTVIFKKVNQLLTKRK